MFKYFTSQLSHTNTSEWRTGPSFSGANVTDNCRWALAAAGPRRRPDLEDFTRLAIASAPSFTVEQEEATVATLIDEIEINHCQPADEAVPAFQHSGKSQGGGLAPCFEWNGEGIELCLHYKEVIIVGKGVWREANADFGMHPRGQIAGSRRVGNERDRKIWRSRRQHSHSPREACGVGVPQHQWDFVHPALLVLSEDDFLRRRVDNRVRGRGGRLSAEYFRNWSAMRCGLDKARVPPEIEGCLGSRNQPVIPRLCLSRCLKDSLRLCELPLASRASGVSQLTNRGDARYHGEVIDLALVRFGLGSIVGQRVAPRRYVRRGNCGLLDG
eukprot:scaffold174709_cov27-Tisochrysis_lutea.AAC.2